MVDLLEAIVATGSISAAGRSLGYSYRRAWLLVDTMNRCWREPLVTTALGGRRGGGAKLTPLGEAVATEYRKLGVTLARAAAAAASTRSLLDSLLTAPRTSQQS